MCVCNIFLCMYVYIYKLGYFFLYIYIYIYGIFLYTHTHIHTRIYIYIYIYIFGIFFIFLYLYIDMKDILICWVDCISFASYFFTLGMIRYVFTGIISFYFLSGVDANLCFEIQKHSPYKRIVAVINGKRKILMKIINKNQVVKRENRILLFALYEMYYKWFLQKYIGHSIEWQISWNDPIYPLFFNVVGNVD